MDSLWATFCTVALLAFGAVCCFEWEALPSPVVYSCTDDKVTFPWRYKLADAELVRDIRWFHNGAFDSVLVGTQTYGYFLPTPSYSQRVRQLANGGLVLSHVTTADTGNYAVEVNTEKEGALLSRRHSVFLQVGDGLMTEGKRLTASQDPTALWDNSTLQWVVRITCGFFTFMGQPPIHVIWTTPKAETLPSSGYDNGYFYLTLATPPEGGNYTCHIPNHFLPDVCVKDSNHGNGTMAASVLVDEVKVRLSLLEAEKRTLKEQLREMVKTHDEEIGNLTGYVNGKLDALRDEVVSLFNISQEQQILLRGPCDSLNHAVLSDVRRAVTYNSSRDLCDKTLTPGWYRFVIDGTNAMMPTECVPIKHCGTYAPYWLDLQGNALPAPGQQTDARACAHWSGNCCHWQAPVSVRNCGAFYLYKLKPYNECTLSFCAKKMDS